MLSGLTVSFPMMLITSEGIKKLELDGISDPELAALNHELLQKLSAVQSPEDHNAMAQVYEAYSEASFWLEMANRGVVLSRTPGTGSKGQQRPDFVHNHQSGPIYFEIKALEIANPIIRHSEIANSALENAAELDGRARISGVHFGEPLALSGPMPFASVAERIDATIEKIANNVKVGQIYYGPTVLVVDIGRHPVMPHGPSNLLPVFFHDEPPAESCVTGEFWQIGWGKSGEQVFCLPEFDGKSNLAGYQRKDGIFRCYPGLLAITFFCPRWSDRAEILTLWNDSFDKSKLTNSCQLEESDIEGLIDRFSDGVNDARNERGWRYRVTPKRT